MADLWLPGRSNTTLALREPGLLSFGRKPVGPVKTQSTVFGKRVLARCVFNRFGLVELVTGRKVILEGATSFGGKTPNTLYTGPTANGNYADVPLLGQLTSPYTLMARIKIESPRKAVAFVAFGDESGGSRSLFYEDSSTDRLLLFNGATNVARTTSFISLAPTGTTNTLCAVNTGIVESTFMYINGINSNRDTVAVGNDSIETTATKMRLGNYFASGFGGDLSFDWVIVTAGAWTAEEVSAFHRNPYMGLSPANQSPYFLSGMTALPFWAGSNQIQSASIGSTPITAIYKGSTQLWP